MYLYLGRIFTLKLAGYMSDGGKQFSQPSEIAVHFGDLLRGAQTGLHDALYIGSRVHVCCAACMTLPDLLFKLYFSHVEQIQPHI